MSGPAVPGEQDADER